MPCFRTASSGVSLACLGWHKHWVDHQHVAKWHSIPPHGWARAALRATRRCYVVRGGKSLHAANTPLDVSVSSGESSHPTVSVIIPAYNAAQFLGPALDSVLAQTFTDYEIIVVDDGSPDADALDAALAPYLDRIRYVRQENRGPSGARNTGIRNATGEFVAFLDSDDLWMPEFLEAQVLRLRDDDHPDVVYTDEVVFGDTPYAGESVMQYFPSRGDVTLDALLDKTCVIPTSTVVARRQALLDVGLFNEEYRCCEDFDLWLRLAYDGASFAYQTRVLARHREHRESITFRPDPLLHAQVAVLTALRNDLDLTSRQRHLLDRRVARCQALAALEEGKRHLLRRRYREARGAVSAANTFFRSRRLKAVQLMLRLMPGVVRLVAVRRHRAQVAADGSKP